MKWKHLTVEILMILAVVAILGLLIDWVPPRSLTDARMQVMKRRILRYAAAHDALPASLDDLPELEAYANEIEDGWGRPIQWSIEENEVTLISYGEDGTPGGADDNADMIGIFRAKTGAGAWADESCEWERDPFGRIANSSLESARQTP